MFKRRFKSTKKFGKNNISRTNENKGTIETYENLQGLTINQIMTKEYLPIKMGGISFIIHDNVSFDVHKACANIYFSIKDYCSLFGYEFDYKLTYNFNIDCMFLFEQLDKVLLNDEGYNIDYIDNEFKVIIYKEISTPRISINKYSQGIIYFLSFCKIEPYKESHPDIYNWFKNFIIALSYYQGIHISEENQFIEMELNMMEEYEACIDPSNPDYHIYSEEEKAEYKDLIEQGKNYLEGNLNDILLEIIEMRKYYMIPLTFHELEKLLDEMDIEKIPIELDELFQHIREGIEMLSSDSLNNYLYNDSFILSEKIEVPEFYSEEHYNPGTLMFNVVYDADDEISQRSFSNITDSADNESPLLFQKMIVLNNKGNSKIEDSEYIIQFGEWYGKLINIIDELNN